MATTTDEVLAGRRLKELTDEEFERLYDCDRFTASVLGSRFRYIVKHMCTHLMRNAFSPIISDWYDFAATIAGPRELDYPMCAVSDSLTFFTGVMASGVPNVVEEFGPENLQPRDILMCNDPTRKGTHPNDVLLIRPVFHGDSILGYVNIQAHMIDMGGTVPGGFGHTKQNVYENGLIIPPMLLMRDDQPIRSAFALIFGNVRFGEIMLPDYLTICSDLRLGDRLLREAIARYGTEAYLGAMRYVTDVGAESFRAAVAALPDGVYEGEDMIDCDGIDASEQYLVHSKVTIAGSRIEVDLSGSSRQARTCINANAYDTQTSVAVALKFLLDPTTPFTSGIFRNLDLVLPIASIVCAMPPDGVVMFNFEVQEPILTSLFAALADAVGEHAIAGGIGCGMTHLAHGLRANGTPYSTVGTCGGETGPWGATRHGDAESALTLYMSNVIAPSTESIEADLPIVLLRKEYLTDSSGAGRNRGGASIVKDSLWLTDADHYPNVMHVRRPSGFGVLGGGAGRGGATWLWEDGPDADGFVGVDDEAYRRAEPVAGVFDPETHLLDPDGAYMHYGRRPVWKEGPGVVFRYINNAGGGWGDPLLREPERVLRDVRDEYTSVERAREVYGVVIEGDPVRDPEALRVDEAATAALRARLADERDA